MSRSVDHATKDAGEKPDVSEKTQAASGPEPSAVSEAPASGDVASTERKSIPSEGSRVPREVGSAEDEMKHAAARASELAAKGGAKGKLSEVENRNAGEDLTEILAEEAAAEADLKVRHLRALPHGPLPRPLQLLSPTSTRLPPSPSPSYAGEARAAGAGPRRHAAGSEPRAGQLDRALQAETHGGGVCLARRSDRGWERFWLALALSPSLRSLHPPLPLPPFLSPQLIDEALPVAEARGGDVYMRMVQSKAFMRYKQFRYQVRVESLCGCACVSPNRPHPLPPSLNHGPCPPRRTRWTCSGSS